MRFREAIRDGSFPPGDFPMLAVEIVIAGQISEQWSEWFEGLDISYPFPTHTALTGQVVDQAALHGLLSRLWDLGLSLISVRTDPLSEPAQPIHVNVRAIIERDTSHGREIIVQVRSKPHERSKCLEIPGGRIESFESFFDALYREVREETGLEVIEIAGLNGRVETNGSTSVECLVPFAAYQTLCGPVDSLGFYFRCRARGRYLPAGDETEEIQWMPVARVAELIAEDQRPDIPDEEKHFSWVDRAGLTFYLKCLNKF
jgi:8-oxo-dGTP diphosphatase